MTERMTVELVDGYRVGDRLLDGVFFTVEVDAESWTEVTVLEVEVDAKSAEYFKGLNAEHWYAQVKERVEEDPYTFLFEDDDVCSEERFEELVAKWGQPQFGTGVVIGFDQ